MSDRSFTARTRARKRAVDVLFEADQRDLMTDRRALLRLLEERRQLTAAQTALPAYAAEVITGVADHLQEIDELLDMHSTNREVDRLPATDRAVLRLATWEIVWNEDVPAITAIDEAVAIAKVISPDDSPARVNAILDAVRKHRGDVLATDEAVEAAFAPLDEAVSTSTGKGTEETPTPPSDPAVPAPVASSAPQDPPPEQAFVGAADGAQEDADSAPVAPASEDMVAAEPEAPVPYDIDLDSLDLDNLPQEVPGAENLQPDSLYRT